MPRPKKCRKVCRLPKNVEFTPTLKTSEEKIIITVDEYETVRLIDMEGFSQEECAVYMQIARTTAQQIYNSARKKIAIALVNGLSIKIEGGDYILCDGSEFHCNCDGCRKHKLKLKKEIQ